MRWSDNHFFYPNPNPQILNQVVLEDDYRNLLKLSKATLGRSTALDLGNEKFMASAGKMQDAYVKDKNAKAYAEGMQGVADAGKLYAKYKNPYAGTQVTLTHSHTPSHFHTLSLSQWAKYTHSHTLTLSHTHSGPSTTARRTRTRPRRRLWRSSRLRAR